MHACMYVLCYVCMHVRMYVCNKEQIGALLTNNFKWVVLSNFDGKGTSSILCLALKRTPLMEAFFDNTLFLKPGLY